MTHTELAHRAVECLLEQAPVEVTHAANWERGGFPLPMKKMPVSPDGTQTQHYRPLAILEYVHEKLSAKAAPPAAADPAEQP